MRKADMICSISPSQRHCLWATQRRHEKECPKGFNYSHFKLIKDATLDLSLVQHGGLVSSFGSKGLMSSHSLSLKLLEYGIYF